MPNLEMVQHLYHGAYLKKFLSFRGLVEERGGFVNIYETENSLFIRG